DKVYLSFETGVCKPDRAIFDYMIVDSYLDPQRCLFLDDGVSNIETAKSMGFQTRLIKPREDFSELFSEQVNE
ncbi:MAG: HAD-IA family hydrolase, partial [Bacteroidales bacterium]|nr:HAD-IA family hydrolase [Bacteroidales bacterium]